MSFTGRVNGMLSCNSYATKRPINTSFTYYIQNKLIDSLMLRSSNKKAAEAIGITEGALTSALRFKDFYENEVYKITRG